MERAVCKWSLWIAFVGFRECCFPRFMDLACIFEVPSSNNDVNILDQSPIFNDILLGKALYAYFKVNGNEYKFGYYLMDGIYPPYSTFMKVFRQSIEKRDKLFKRRKKGAL